MKLKLLTAAALGAAVALTGAPAGAEHRSAAIGVPNATSPDGGRHFDLCQGGDRRHDRHDAGVNCVVDSYAYADGEWALYNNRSWAPDSYNDWWHDRPDRAFPRWVQEQRARGTCDPSRMWWSGSGWHC
ncbi:MAG TPA: hypothetical protein VGM04_05110 [Sphingomicrobium sp.]|jgi:hypothetical protein